VISARSGGSWSGVEPDSLSSWDHNGEDPGPPWTTLDHPL
jgi:hypothetical protein